jgi:Rieske 2Fe-2S family protein
VTAVREPAPLAAEALAPALRPFGEGTMLPAAAYTSAEVFRWEQRAFLASSWTCVGRVDDLFPAGDNQVATRVGDVPVLLVREGAADDAAAGTGSPLRAYANTCRHRGHELLPEGGSAAARAIVCPYHAWSYRTDGSLLAAPGFDEVGTFDPAAHGLVPLPVRTWHGWVLVVAAGGGPDLATHLGALPSLVAPYAPERLVRGAAHEYDVAANWKVLTENYHECYHCPLIHPELCEVTPPTSGDNYDLPGAWVGGSMDLRDGVQTMSLDGRSRGRPIPGVDPRTVLYLGLFPNLLLSLHPDYVMAHRLTPLAPDRTRVECSWYFPGADVDPSYAVDFWDRTNRQDWAACESVQRGLASPHFAPGPFAPSEDAVHQFVVLVARGYLGPDGSAADG